MTCKHAKECKLYDKTSYTCSHEGGRYCGKYRELEGEDSLNAKLNEEILFQQTEDFHLG